MKLYDLVLEIIIIELHCIDLTPLLTYLAWYSADRETSVAGLDGLLMPAEEANRTFSTSAWTTFLEIIKSKASFLYP